MNIEISKQTFDDLTITKDGRLKPVDIEELQQAVITTYYSDKANARIDEVYNYVGDIVQFYLYDINS